MASKYGIAFTKSRVLQAFAYIASVHKLFWEYTQDYFSGNKWGDAYTKKR